MPTINKDVISELQRLFKQGLSLYSCRLFEDYKSVFRQAMELAEKHELHSDKLLFQCGDAFAEENWKEADSLLEKALHENNGKLVLRNEVLYYRGVAKSNQREFKQAIDLFRKVLEYKECYFRGTVWYDRGGVYDNIGRPDNAIKCYTNALVDKSYDAPGIALNSMGLAYDAIGDQKKAIECYEKAINEKSYDTPGIAWNNMGLAYDAIGDQKKAIKCYKKALAEKSCESSGHTWFNIARAHKTLDNYDHAKSALLRAKEEYIIQNQLDGISSVNKFLTVLDGLIKKRRDEEQNKFDEFLSKEAVKAELQTKNNIEDYRKQYDEKPQLKNWLICLRGWASATNALSHILPDSYGGERCTGGGFLLTWNDKVHIVDPGTDFIENFSKFKPPCQPDNPKPLPLHFLQVHSVQTTHWHPDHSGDLEEIAHLDYEIATNEKDRHLICNLDYDTRSTHMPPMLKTLMNENRKGCSCSQITDGNVTNKKTIQPCDLEDETVTLEAFPVFHESAAHARGFKFLFHKKDSLTNPTVVGFTGDTAWDSTLPKNLDGSNIIVCNFSSMRLGDLDEERQKPDHLGLKGVSGLIKQTNAQIYIITEFWGQTGDIRVPLASHLRTMIKTVRSDNPVIIPGDVGLVIDIDTKEIMCSYCRKFYEAKKITVIVPKKFGQLLYLCPKHTVVQTPEG